MKHSVLFASLLFAYLFTHAQEAARIDSLIAKFTADAQFTGTVLVSKKGTLILNKGYGMRHAENKIPNNPHTIYNIASLTKSFTAALILKLQEENKLSVQDPLSKYDPSFPNGERITLHHLLTHTSGIANYTEDKTFQFRDQAKETSLDTMIALFRNKPLQFAPGTRFQYSNSGYTLLGYVIEKVTGKPYGVVLEEMIFQPLGMKNTTYGPPAQKNLATGYQMYFNNFKKPAPPVHPSVSYATGAIYSTATDLFLFHKAMQGNRFLSAPSKTAAYKRDAGAYGYGWQTDTLYGAHRASHSGNISGYKSNINRFPADDICVIALSNANNSGVGEMVRQIVNILYQQPLAKTFFEQPNITIADSVLNHFTGRYYYGPQDTAGTLVQLSGSKLVVQVGNQPVFSIDPVTPNQFRSGTETRIEFMNYNGQLQMMIFQAGNLMGMSRDSKRQQ